MTDAKQNLSELKADLLSLLHQHSVARGIAAYRLANETCEGAQLLQLEAALEKADWLIPRCMASIAVLMVEPCELRQQFVEDSEFRAIVVEEVVQAAETRSSGDRLLGAVVAQAVRMAAMSQRN